MINGMEEAVAYMRENAHKRYFEYLNFNGKIVPVSEEYYFAIYYSEIYNKVKIVNFNHRQYADLDRYIFITATLEAYSEYELEDVIRREITQDYNGYRNIIDYKRSVYDKRKYKIWREARDKWLEENASNLDNPHDIIDLYNLHGYILPAPILDLRKHKISN